MRVLIAAESFLPAVNGVAHSVVRVLDHLHAHGHEAMVLAPGDGPDHHGPTPVVRVPAVPLPVYRSLPVAVPSSLVEETLVGFGPDVVHLAAPISLGAAAGRAARRHGVPAVAVYQTDFAGFAERYHFRAATRAVWRVMARVHDHADLTLAPSRPALWDLRHHGIGPAALWPRGVDLDRFSPHRRDELWRRRTAPGGEPIIGFVGRLAPEKRLDLLTHLQGLGRHRLVVVGDGPSRKELERKLPDADFLGFRTGDELPRIVASLDAFVHTGSDETFCQAIQEALASGVPVVAPAAGGPLDLVTPGVNGWLWSPDDPGQLRGAVGSLIDDPHTRRRMAGAARPGVAHRSWDVVCADLVEHYRSVLGAPGAPRASGVIPFADSPVGRAGRPRCPVAFRPTDPAGPAPVTRPATSPGGHL